MNGGPERHDARDTRRWEDQLVAGRPRETRPSAAQGRRPSRERPRIRWPGVALVISAVVVLGGLAWQVGEATVGAFRDVATAGPARPEDVVGGLAGGAMFALMLWLALAVAASAVAALLPTRPGRASALGRMLAPAVVRHLVAALVGAAVIGAAAPAGADVGDLRARSTSCTAAVVVAPAASPGDTTDDLSAAWHPTEPVVSAGWLPTEPVVRPPSRPGADASVVTSSRRRTSVLVDDEVVVRRGDTLWSLAERHLGPAATAAQVNREWPRWFAANRSVLTHGPDHLVAGMRLRPPPLLAATGTESPQAGTRDALR